MLAHVCTDALTHTRMHTRTNARAPTIVALSSLASFLLSSWSSRTMAIIFGLTLVSCTAISFLFFDLDVWYCLCMALSLMLHLCHELEHPLSISYTLFSLLCCHGCFAGFARLW